MYRVYTIDYTHTHTHTFQNLKLSYVSWNRIIFCRSSSYLLIFRSIQNNIFICRSLSMFEFVIRNALHLVPFKVHTCTCIYISAFFIHFTTTQIAFLVLFNSWCVYIMRLNDFWTCSFVYLSLSLSRSYNCFDTLMPLKNVLSWCFRLFFFLLSMSLCVCVHATKTRTIIKTMISNRVLDLFITFFVCSLSIRFENCWFNLF